MKHFGLVTHIDRIILLDSGQMISLSSSFSQLQKKYDIVSKKVQLEVSAITGKHCKHLELETRLANLIFISTSLEKT